MTLFLRRKLSEIDNLIVFVTKVIENPQKIISEQNDSNGREMKKREAKSCKSTWMVMVGMIRKDQQILHFELV